MGSSSSESQANQETTTQNTDKRIATEGSIVATDGAQITANIESIDGDVVKGAFDFATEIGSQNAEGFGQLIGIAEKIFSTGSSMIESGQKQVLSALQSVENDKRGAIDQKTMIVLGVAAAAALVLVKRK